MKLSTLYKKSSTGKMLSWDIQTDGATIIETWGQIGGKMQSTADTIKEGKNIGKANETTAVQQAEAEAQAKWTKKLKGHNYTESQEDAMAGKSSEVVEGGTLPMLAKKYCEDGDKIVWPAFSQVKLDGHRMTSQRELGGSTTLWTRTRKQMFSLPHITVAIDRMWKRTNVVPFVIDGEAYNHSYHDKFEELTHYIRQSKYVAGSEVVQYHIYDAAIPGLPFNNRTALLAQLLEGEPKDSPLKRVETILVNDEDELMIAFEKFRAEGYEGAIIRNAAGLYVGKRSYDLQKVKEFDDAEFLVVGVTEGRGSMVGHAVFVCQTDEGRNFEAKMKGERANLKQYWENPKLCVGRKATVQYQGLTTKNKVPRFPVAVRLQEAL